MSSKLFASAMAGLAFSNAIMVGISAFETDDALISLLCMCMTIVLCNVGSFILIMGASPKDGE